MPLSGQVATVTVAIGNIAAAVAAVQTFVMEHTFVLIPHRTTSMYFSTGNGSAHVSRKVSLSWDGGRPTTYVAIGYI